MKKSDTKTLVKRKFNKSKSRDYKKLYRRGNDGFAGLSQRKICRAIFEDKTLRKLSVKFTKKARPRPVRVKALHDQHQIDLINMKNMVLVYKGKTCKRRLTSFFFCFFFYKNSFYKNHKAQNCQKTKNILRIMARLKYIIKNLESPILILHQESALFTMECLLFTVEGLQFRKTCVRNQHSNQSKHS